MFGRRRILSGFGLILVAGLAWITLVPRHQLVEQNLPDKLSDADFWNLITEASEPGGYFRSENFVSNESAYQHVIPALKKQIRPGGVYFGVGPDQNFTYVAALRPKLAFVVDIRRQNMLLHLMYKALFELSNNRTEFLSKLFARPTPTAGHAATTTEDLFAAFAEQASDPELAKDTLGAIIEQLRNEHHFDLSPDDTKTIETVYNAFVSGGPDIRYSYPNQYAWKRFPSYADLMLETDGTAENGGENHSYMASEENFQSVRLRESRNAIIPIVGDFAGEKALRAVGRFVRLHGATVSVFYTSNVEFYLFQTDDWKKFFKTVSDLPVGPDSVFIRSFFNNSGLQFPDPPGWFYSPPPSYTLVGSMPTLISDFSAGRIHRYFDVIRQSAP
jgi:hypothetical protein